MSVAMSASLVSRPAAGLRKTTTAAPASGRAAARCALVRASGDNALKPVRDAMAAAGAAAVAGTAAPALAKEMASAAEAVDTAAVESALQEAEVAVQAAAAAAAVDAPKQVEKFVEQAAVALKDAAVKAAEEGMASTTAQQAAASASVSADMEKAAVAMKEAAKAAQRAGADVDVVEKIQSAMAAITDAAATAQELATPAIKAAQPAIREAVTVLTTTDPAVLAEYALGAIGVAYLLPPLLKAGLEAARGYAGEMQPTGVLDALVSSGSNALVDIRSVQDKEDTGIPDLADPSKLVQLEFVAVEDDKLYSRLRNAPDVEAESTAIQIGALKVLNRGMTLYIMDVDGSVARSVAKQLAKRGFSKTFVVAGGMQSWTSARLRTRAYNPAALLPEKAGAM